MIKGVCDGCREVVFEKAKAIEIIGLTFCPVCVGRLKAYFSQGLNPELLKEEIKKSMCDSCHFNPYHEPTQVFYRRDRERKKD
jgi:hypothetical protein